MNRPFAAFLIGAALLAQAALASDSHADVGRYQLIPGVSVPNKAGKMQEQTVLLDTESGRTWRLEQAEKSGGASGLRWEPLAIKLDDRVSAAANPGSAASKTSAKTLPDTNPKFKSRTNRLGEDYDNDP